MTRRKTSTEVARVKQSAEVASTQTMSASVRCIYASRLVISADKLPTWRRMVFEPGQVQAVTVAEQAALLSMIYKQSACCGAPQLPPGRYFEAA